MRVLLVNPSYEIDRYMGKHLGRMGWVMPPMGLLYLAAVLERAGDEVVVYDAQIEPRPLETVLNEVAPEIVGITCASALVESTVAAAELVKRRSADTVVIVGGVHPTVCPDEMLACAAVDAAVRGEGISSIGEIARAVEAGAGFADITGLSWRRDGDIVHNPSRPLEKDVDAFPFPARHLVPMNRYRMSPDLSVRPPFDFVFGAYGCPHDCSFCAAQVVGGGAFRMRSIANVLAEIDQIVTARPVRTLIMGDDNFVISAERTFEFCDGYSARGHHRKVQWQVSTRVDSVSPEILRAMKAAGCYLVSFGIESGVDRLLRGVDKGQTAAQSEAAVRWAKEAGLLVRATVILGLPGETPDESEQTIRFARRLPLDQVRFALATPFPGTALWAQAEAEGLVHVDDWMSLSLMGGYREGELPYVPPGRDAAELKRLQRRANLAFYLRPRIMWGFARRSRSPAELWEYTRAAWGLLRATFAVG